jgi:hypothetical protein
MASTTHFLTMLLVAELAILGGADEGGLIGWNDILINDGSPSIRVAQDGSGDVETIQGAIDLVPANNKQRMKILVMPGIYK